MSHRQRVAARARREDAANRATARRYAHAVPDSVALDGDAWSIGLAAITNSLHKLGVTHISIQWWHPVLGKGERPPTGQCVTWVVKVCDPAGREICAGHSTQTTQHGVGIVEAGADAIRTYIERRRDAA